MSHARTVTPALRLVAVLLALAGLLVPVAPIAQAAVPDEVPFLDVTPRPVGVGHGLPLVLAGRAADAFALGEQADVGLVARDSGADLSEYITVLTGDDEDTVRFEISTALAVGFYDVVTSSSRGATRGELQVVDPEIIAWPRRLHTVDLPRRMLIELYGLQGVDGAGQVRVHDADGSLLDVVTNVARTDPESVNYDLAPLVAGTYTVELVLGGRTFTSEFIVARPSATLFPDALRAGYAGPAELDVDVSHPWLDEESTVRIVDRDGALLVDVTEGLTLTNAHSGTLDVPAGLPIGRHVVELTTGSGVLRGPVTIMDAYAWSRPARFVEASTPRALKIIGHDTTWDTGSAVAIVRQPDGATIADGVVDVAVTDAEHLTVTIAGDLLPGRYGVRVETDGHVRVAAFLVLADGGGAPRPAAATASSAGGSIHEDSVTGSIVVTMPRRSLADLVLRSGVVCDGAVPVRVAVRYAGRDLEMTPVGGAHEVRIEASELEQAGSGSLELVADCGSGETAEPLGEIVLYDPSGTIIDADTDEPVAGAVVSVYEVPGWAPRTSPAEATADTCESNASRDGAVWSQPAPTEIGVAADAVSGRIDPELNPQTTSAFGDYGWDVAEGCWYVTVSAAGYEDLVSPVVGVGPPPVGAVTDLDLALTPLRDVVAPAWGDAAALVVGTVTDTTAHLTWPAATDDRAVLEYVVRRDGDVLAVLTSASREHVVRGLVPGTTFELSVEAQDAARNAGLRLVAEVTTSYGADQRAQEPGVARISGAGRAETAAAVSAATFAAGVPVAYVATMGDFPDALAGGPVAARDGGPILLVRQTSIPEATRAELERLAPRRIVVLGGTAVVGDGVLAELAPLTTGAVDRLAGGNRYETAAAISRDAFDPADVDVVYVATGSSFPDALAGGVLAARDGAPVLLVGASLPTATRDEIFRLDPERIVILGGPAAVSSTIEAFLRAYAPTVDRISGSDRYATAAAVVAQVETAGAVYLATGRNFPDALAGVPVAATVDGVILLVGNSLTVATEVQIERLAPQRLRVLGGVGVVSDLARDQAARHLSD